jgi:hypothetical protein
VTAQLTNYEESAPADFRFDGAANFKHGISSTCSM